MKAYSTDLRARAVAAVEEGMPRLEVCRCFGLSLPTLKRLLRQKRQVGHVAPQKQGGSTPRITLQQHAALEAQLRNYPDARLEEHCRLWQEHQGVAVSVATMSRSIGRLGWTRKKSS